jgi:catechol 2,3-dioxygenase-like lactoylglutathione lyase family enzyme
MTLLRSRQKGRRSGQKISPLERDKVASMTEEMVPIFRAEDAAKTAKWYARLGFEVVSEHRFAPEPPLYLFLECGDVQLHLSEHTGDATPNTLVYFWVDDVDSIATEFSVNVKDQPWARKIELTDPDGNRLRIATGH